MINNYFKEMQHVLADIDEDSIKKNVEILFGAWKKKKQIFTLGNGGSASTASHMANDLSKATITAGLPRMKVIALTDNISLITAWANDASYNDIFREQLANFLEPEDVVLGISASGNSPNVLRAMEFSRAKNAVTVGWTGKDGGRLKDLVDLSIQVSTNDVGMIEGLHLILDHLVTSELSRLMQAEGQALTSLNTSE